MEKNLMNVTIIEGQSISRPPYFDGTNYSHWKERMRIFIQSIDFKLWLVITSESNIPKKVVDGKEVEKSEDEFDDEDMKKMEQDAKVKNIFYCAVNADNFQKISTCKTAKEMWDKLDREMTVPVMDSNAGEPRLARVASSQYTRPDLVFLAETREAMDDFLNLCVPLHTLALEGNWREAKRILDQDRRLRHAAIAKGWPTVLHVAAGANHVPFVEELLRLMDEDNSDLALQDAKGNTAFCFAAAAGNVPIAQLMLQRNELLPTIRGGDGLTPVQFAALQGRCEMARFLYNRTKDEFQEQDWNLLFFTCISTGIYDLALEMARKRPALAFAKDENGETGLHLLAQKPLDCCCQIPERPTAMINPGMKQHVVLQLVRFLWDTILRDKVSKEEIYGIISEPSHLLFDAAEVGNVGFVSELMSAFPDLIWEADSRNRSIIHIAVLNRHASIYNLIHEIGSQKDIIVTYVDSDNQNTLLHLAAKLAPPDQLQLVSGAAFQMCLELVWFEEVKKKMAPSFIKLKNSKGLTARELFTKKHAKLRKNAEAWMKGTAESCMLISTVIATGVYSAAISLPGGTNDNTGKPNYLDKTSFLVFALSDATALISSATSILIFLSILISRYAEYDFYKSLPLKLICGLITLFISITSMMIAFGCAFFITYYYGVKWVPSSISILACLPTLLFIFLQFSLWSDIIYSTYYCRNLFKPGKNMILRTREVEAMQ